MYEQRTLANGVRLVWEHVAGVRSAALGVWVASGSRDEKAGENGAAHFIEHMVFKGTETQSAGDIARRMDAIGGQVNAFTTRECTCFYARALDTHLPEALDILCDMFFNARFDQADVETERGVILEEIGMYRDAPDDLCSEKLAAGVYRGSSLARPILGTPATLKKMTGPWLKDYMRAHYTPDRVVVSLAGSFDPAVVEALADRFGALSAPAAPRWRPAEYRPVFTVKKKRTEQNHLTLAFPGLPLGSPDRFAMQLLSFILGGGMSSRLFQEVREKRGLCYSVYSYGACHEDVGLFAVYTALGKELEGEALRTVMDVLRTFRQDGPTEEELNLAREQSKSSVLMGMESTTARMNHMARSTLYQDHIMTQEEIVAAYDAVTREDVLALARRTLDFGRMSLSAVGKVAPAEEYQGMLEGLAE